VAVISKRLLKIRRFRCSSNRDRSRLLEFFYSQDGLHTVVASETDSGGNTGTGALAFTLDTVAPAVTATLANVTGLCAQHQRHNKQTSVE
jgi:hypothetical protein